MIKSNKVLLKCPFAGLRYLWVWLWWESLLFSQTQERAAARLMLLGPSMAPWPPLAGVERTWAGGRSQSWFCVHSLNSFAYFL